MSAAVIAEETHSDRTYTKDVQNHSAVSPVLVCEDVIGEFMESCKKGGKKKVQMLHQLPKPTTLLLSNIMKSCPSPSAGHQSYNCHAGGSLFFASLLV